MCSPVCGVPGVCETENTAEMEREKKVEKCQWLVGEGAGHCVLLQFFREGEGKVVSVSCSLVYTHSEQLGLVEGERGKKLRVIGHGRREEEFL